MTQINRTQSRARSRVYLISLAEPNLRGGAWANGRYRSIAVIESYTGRVPTEIRDTVTQRVVVAERRLCTRVGSACGLTMRSQYDYAWLRMRKDYPQAIVV